MLNDQTNAESMRNAFRDILSRLCVSAPGLVRKVSGDSLEVLPMVNRRGIDGKCQKYSDLHDVTLLQLGGAGWEIKVDVQVGDIVWLFFADSGLDEWKKSHLVVTPQTNRSHALSDAVALPLNLGIGSAGSLTIQNTTGTAGIEFTDSKITLKGNVDVSGLLRVGTLLPTAVTVNTHIHQVGEEVSSPPTPGS